MTKTYPWTFDAWRRGECSEVTRLDPEDLSGYQSEYLEKFNFLRDRGWFREGGRWVQPDYPYHTYGDIHRAYSSQKLKETIGEEDGV